MNAEANESLKIYNYITMETMANMRPRYLHALLKFYKKDNFTLAAVFLDDAKTFEDKSLKWDHTAVSIKDAMQNRSILTGCRFLDDWLKVKN